MTTGAAEHEHAVHPHCWCCGNTFDDSDLTHLGANPQVDQLTTFKYRIHGSGQTRPVKSEKTSERRAPITPHAPGMRIGLLVERSIRRMKPILQRRSWLKRLKVDGVWWLVTPGNPLENTRGLAPLANRIAAARALTGHPRIDITGLEAVIKTGAHDRYLHSGRSRGFDSSG